MNIVADARQRERSSCHCAAHLTMARGRVGCGSVCGTSPRSDPQHQKTLESSDDKFSCVYYTMKYLKIRIKERIKLYWLQGHPPQPRHLPGTQLPGRFAEPRVLGGEAKSAPSAAAPRSLDGALVPPPSAFLPCLLAFLSLHPWSLLPSPVPGVLAGGGCSWAPGLTSWRDVGSGAALPGSEPSSPPPSTRGPSTSLLPCWPSGGLGEAVAPAWSCPALTDRAPLSLPGPELLCHAAPGWGPGEFRKAFVPEGKASLPGLLTAPCGD